MYNINKLLIPYSAEKHIAFTSNNINRLWECLDSVDKRLFNFDLTALNWGYYWEQALKGGRVYVVKDPMETIPEGRKLSFK